MAFHVPDVSMATGQKMCVYYYYYYYHHNYYYYNS